MATSTSDVGLNGVRAASPTGACAWAPPSSCRASEDGPPAHCLARLRHLRAEELQLFAEVRAHRFADLAESDYWQRGRLKFPGEIEQTPERIEGR
jgi:hypothetical protein